MSPASPSFPSDSRLKWKRRKRESNLGNNGKRQKPQEDEDYEDEEEDEATPAQATAAAAEEEEDDQDFPGSSNADAAVDLRQSEVLSDGSHRISDFPVVVKHTVNRPHPSVLAIIAAERSLSAGSRTRCPVILENVSHGQLQALSAILPDNPSLNPLLEHDSPPAYVCTPPALMEGKGVVKRFGDSQFLVVPLHSDWFNPSTVHRLERQVVPHFFTGKSNDYTPESYMTLRNKIILKYMENPERRFSIGDCQSLVSGSELYDLSRVVRFLDHWGIINYLAVVGHRGLRIIGSVIREEANGELLVQTTPLKSIDSLVQFGRPKSSYRLEDISSLSSSLASSGEVPDLDSRIRERLSEFACSYCSRPLPNLHYQSQKEADVILCSDCFHDAKYISGHTSVDFVRMDSMKDISDPDGDSWTDQETLLLLEALEMHNDNWNEIAEHVGTKSKAQCILQFIRLPMEDGLLENIELPHMDVSCINSDNHNGKSYPNSNGVCIEERSSGQLPFANTRNPVMALVAFLASTIGPRVAAACASASLSVLAKGNPKVDRSSESMHIGQHPQGKLTNMGHQKDEAIDNTGFHGIMDDASAPLSSERVKLAATCGLSAATMKAKMFADQEEREVQRLVANILNYQLKRLELKLKQFAEVETLLLKECEQVERTRQRLLAERVRLMSNRFPAAGTIPAAVATTGATNSNLRQTILTPSVGQVNVPSSYGGNLPGHPHMSFMPRQPLFPFGPRLPLSAIHPSSSASATNVMLPSGMAYTPTPNHPLSRPLSGNNAN